MTMPLIGIALALFRGAAVVALVTVPVIVATHLTVLHWRARRTHAHEGQRDDSAP